MVPASAFERLRGVRRFDTVAGAKTVTMEYILRAFSVSWSCHCDAVVVAEKSHA
jgi:hypothetical protein